MAAPINLEIMTDTITAISTAPGMGGIGIVRLSGPDSRRILEDIFVPAKGEIKARVMTHGHIVEPGNGMVIDEVLAVYMPAPATYTKEDVVEINCHGGQLPLSKALELTVQAGARMAEPGEFTKRAFLNGRIDLSQAEAVLDVINAKTEDSLDAALDQLQGKFSEEIKAIQKGLTDVLVDVAVNIDYPDEDIEELTKEKLCEDLENILGKIKELLATADSGKILRDGLAVSIVGKPNVGKSSLLNLLLRETRAIVTDIPGTTRDTIEEFANIKGIPLRLTDTAGIRDTRDQIEAIGIERAKKSIDEADLILMLIDVSEELDQENIELLQGLDPSKTILIFNKEDKGEKIPESQQKKLAEDNNIERVLKVSLKSKGDLEKIENEIYEAAGYVEASARAGSIVTNQRHKTLLARAAQSLDEALTAAGGGAALELLEIDIRSAYEELGFITGDSVQDDIIDEVFSRFCLGK